MPSLPHATRVPLVSYLRARPLLLAWAESLGCELETCPLSTPAQYVYFTARPGDYVKVGWTRNPQTRPFESYRQWNRKVGRPLLLIGDAGTNVESLIKLAARDFCLQRRRSPLRPWRELFSYAYPILQLIGELRCAADASLFMRKDGFAYREWSRAMESA